MDKNSQKESIFRKLKNKVNLYVTKKKKNRSCTISKVEDFYKIKANNNNILKINNEYDYITYAGFYGNIRKSTNHKSVIVFNTSYYSIDDKYSCRNGKFAIFYANKLLTKQEHAPLFRILNSTVSNSGIFGICFNLEKEESLFCILMIYNYQLDKTFVVPIKAYFEFINFSNNEKYLLIKTYGSQTAPEHSFKVILIGTEKGDIKLIFNILLDFRNADIDDCNNIISLKRDKQKVLYKMQFDDNYQIQKVFFNDMCTEGKISYLEETNTQEELLKNSLYAELLEKSLLFEENPYTHKKLGKYYDINNDITKALYHYEIALSMNDKIGVKRRYNVLQKKVKAED